jgi:hypothetical protein
MGAVRGNIQIRRKSVVDEARPENNGLCHVQIREHLDNSSRDKRRISVENLHTKK